MLLSELVATSSAVRGTSGRREKIDRLADLLRRLDGEEIEIGVAYLSGSPRQRRLGIGPAALSAAGAPAAAAATLELAEVDAALAAIARVAGTGSTAVRAGGLQQLMGRATAAEQEFLWRLILGELRQGALQALVAEAVARAAGRPAKEVRRALAVSGELGGVARAALDPETAPAEDGIQLFRPLQPMLAQSAAGATEALERFGEALLEFKLDGARVQVHKAGGDVVVYSRRLNDVTVAVPDVVEAVRGLPVREAILDGEAIALRSDGTPLPFQTTVRRFGRRRDVDRLRAELPLSLFLFDLLYLDGDGLLDEPLDRRAAALAEVAPPELLVPRLLARAPDEAEAFLAEALRIGHEGVMAKSPAGLYEAGARAKGWLKVKPAHTLDLVILAAEWGHGRRKGWLSNLHLGARDPQRGGFVMLGKTFKGMTDQMLGWQTERLLALEVARDAYTVHVRPELVVEVAFNDVQASPHYPGGLALRFARVKRHRPDKAANQADTMETVREIYRRATGAEPPSDALTGG